MTEGQTERSLQFHLARGSRWGVAARWMARLLGLVNVLILARLLTPSDFGVVTIAVIVSGVIEVFGQTGQDFAIIRHPAPTRAHYDSAWTMSVLLGFGMGLAIWLAAPVTVIYFNEPRASDVVHIFAGRVILHGFVNVGVVNFQRQFRFRALSAYNSAPSFVSFVVGIAAAIVLRNYWALVIGIVVQEFAGVFLSYAMEPYRPRISFVKVREIWSFSFWTLARNIGVYVGTQVDKIAIGGFAGTSTMGRYEAATDIATSPTAEINTPVIAALSPVMAKVQDDEVRRREIYFRLLYWSALICTSTAVGVSLISNDLVDVVLGPRWTDAKPLMPWLALAFGAIGVSNSVYTAFMVVGRPKTSAKLQWAALAALAGCILAAAIVFHSPRAVAIARFVISAATAPLLFWALAQDFGISAWNYLSIFWRPILASGLMAFAIIGMNTLLQFVGPTRLIFDVALGVAIYSSVIMATWFLVGRPDGPETIVHAVLTRSKNLILSLGPNIART